MKRVSFLALSCLLVVFTPVGMTVAEEPVVDIGSMRMAIEDLMGSFPEEYPDGRKYLERAGRIAQLPEGQERNDALKLLQRESLLENPLLDFGHLVVVRRRSEGDRGLPANWQGNERLKGNNYTNDLALLSLDRLDAPLGTVFRPEKRLFVGDLDLDFDGKQLLFSRSSGEFMGQFWRGESAKVVI